MERISGSGICGLQLNQIVDTVTGLTKSEGFNMSYARKCGMKFGDALELVKEGGKVARPGWNGSGMYLQAQFPDRGSKITFPYLYLTVPECEEGTRLLPWQPAQVDLFQEDWIEL